MNNTSDSYSSVFPAQSFSIYRLRVSYSNSAFQSMNAPSQTVALFHLLILVLYKIIKFAPQYLGHYHGHSDHDADHPPQQAHLPITSLTQHHNPGSINV